VSEVCGVWADTDVSVSSLAYVLEEMSTTGGSQAARGPLLTTAKIIICTTKGVSTSCFHNTVNNELVFSVYV
jgi:hypothetical protein